MNVHFRFCSAHAHVGIIRIPTTFFNTVHFVPKDLRFEQTGSKLAFCPGGHLTSLRPFIVTDLNSTQPWASEGGGPPVDFEITRKKRLFFQFRGVKTKFNHFWSALEKIPPTPMVSTRFWLISSCVKCSCTDCLSISYCVRRIMSCRYGKRAFLFCHKSQCLNVVLCHNSTVLS